MSKISILSFFPTTLTIDGQAIDVRVRRMTNAEFDAWAKAFDEHGGARGEPPTPLDAATVQAQEDAARAWIRATLTENLTVLADQLEKDGIPLRNAGELLDWFGGRADVVPQALGLIHLENHLSEQKKTVCRLALDFSLGLRDAPPPAAPGDAPVPTAESAAPNDSAPPAPAAASLLDASSGMTAQTPVKEVPAFA